MKKNIGKMLSYIAILGIICVTAFIIAKYIVRKNINNDEIPVDTSTRLN